MALLYVAQRRGDASALQRADTENPFAQFHISPNVKEREYLTENEIKTVMTHEFESPTLTLVRDLFIFACFTALSFVDMKELPRMRL